MTLNPIRRWTLPLAFVAALCALNALAGMTAAAPSTKGKTRCVDGTGAIAGTVLDANGVAAAGATVHARAAMGLGGMALAEADGSYRIEGLCAGDYRVRAHLRGAGTGQNDVDGDGVPDPISLTDDAPEATDVILTLPGTPRGKLARSAACTDPQGSIAGVVVDAVGDPVPGVKVRVMQGRERAETASEDNGSYLLEDLCPGDWKVAAQARGMGTGTGHYDADGDGDPDPVSLSNSAPAATDIDITLPGVKKNGPKRADIGAPPRCTDPQGSITGLVRDQNGDPVAGARVEAHGPGGKAKAESGEGGSYLLEDLCPGDYRLKAQARGGGAGQPDTDGDGRPDLVKLTTDAPAATGVDIVLRKRGGF